MKLLIVDDSSAVYRRLISLLGGIERLTALSIARSLVEAQTRCREVHPDAVVLDIDLADGSGLGAIKSIRAECPRATIFVFSNHIEFRALALARGADGFYDKSMEFESLVAHLLGALPGAGPMYALPPKKEMWL